MRVGVIGCGVVGLFTSYYLTREGVEVTIYDTHPIGGRASEYNAGLITPSFASAPRLSITMISRAIFGMAGPIRVSLWELVRNVRWFTRAIRSYGAADETIRWLASKSLELHLDLLSREMIDVDLIRGVIAAFRRKDDAEILARISGGRVISEENLEDMGYTGLGGGVYVENEISINPAKLYWGLRGRVVEMGVRILDAEVTYIEALSNGVRLVSNEGSEIFSSVVITAGSRSRELCKRIGFDPMILPARGLVMLYRSNNTEIVDSPALLEDYGVAISQHDIDNVRITGLFELIGYRTGIGKHNIEWLLSIARRHIKRYKRLSLKDIGIGYRPCSSDLMPVIGEIPGHRGLYIASGLCRLGVTLAPIAGRIIASMITGSRIPIDRWILDLLSPSRFSKHGGEKLTS